MKILVIDDEPAIIGMVRMATRGVHEVDGATEMEEGARLAESGRYVVVVLDYMMKGHDGAWFMEHTRLPPSTKVLLLTGLDDSATIARMVGLGVAGCFIKPVPSRDLVRWIADHVGGDAGLVAIA